MNRLVMAEILSLLFSESMSESVNLSLRNFLSWMREILMFLMILSSFFSFSRFIKLLTLFSKNWKYFSVHITVLPSNSVPSLSLPVPALPFTVRFRHVLEVFMFPLRLIMYKYNVHIKLSGQKHTCTHTVYRQWGVSRYSACALQRQTLPFEVRIVKKKKKRRSRFAF